MHTDHSQILHTVDLLSPWLSNSRQRAIAIEFETAPIFLHIDATGCMKDKQLLKKG